MKYSTTLIDEFENKLYDQLLSKIYVDSNRISYERKRYINALKQYETLFGQKDVEIYSAPGRSEIIGNHTDHQHGEVIATSINDDIIAIVSKSGSDCIRIVSDNSPMLVLSLYSLDRITNEEGTTLALIKGVLSGLKDKGYNLGSFDAYVTSDVLVGAGLSSSAAFETLIGTIISGLFNDMRIDPVEIARIGQYAENMYFGKPCGLMDQMACSIGGFIHINFADTVNPVATPIGFNMEEYGYSLCIVDTKGSHSDLTSDYSAIPSEMKSVANYFGKTVLGEVSKDEFFANLGRLNNSISHRAILRAIHFFEENERVRSCATALKSNNIEEFLKTICASGNSSFKYLQNIYTNSDVTHQNISLALAISETILKDNGVVRVHGGGFAGTIQAFVKNEYVTAYKTSIEEVFGLGSCKILKIREYGGLKVV